MLTCFWQCFMNQGFFNMLMLRHESILFHWPNMYSMHSLFCKGEKRWNKMDGRLMIRKGKHNLCSVYTGQTSTQRLILLNHLCGLITFEHEIINKIMSKDTDFFPLIESNLDVAYTQLVSSIISTKWCNTDIFWKEAAMNCGHRWKLSRRLAKAGFFCIDVD